MIPFGIAGTRRSVGVSTGLGIVVGSWHDRTRDDPSEYGTGRGT